MSMRNLTDLSVVGGNEIDQKLAKLVTQTRPDLVCLEKLFFSKNVRTASIVSEARGVALLVLRRYDIPLLEFTPSEVKSMIAGKGNGSKDDVREAVKMTLGLKDIPGPDDVSDALAIAISGSLVARLRGA